MPEVDLNSLIRQLVEETVVEMLAPYASVLDRMVTLMGTEPTPRAAPARRAAPAAAAAPAAKPARRRRGGASRRAARQGGGDPSRFHEGQMVRYRQGRGEFDAKIIGINSATNTVVVQRTSDNKQVERPADKIYEVA